MRHHDWANVENAVYKTLSRVEWKRSIHIINEVNEGREDDDEVPMAQIYVVLEKAEIQGWVERQERKLASLGRKPMKIAEYKLTGGLRGQETPKEKGWLAGILGGLVPKMA